MIVCVIMLLVFGWCFLKYRNYKKEVFDALPKKGNELKAFFPVAYAVMVILNQHKINFSQQWRRKKIESLNVVETDKDTEILYNIRRIALVMVIVLLSAVFGLLYSLSDSTSGKITDYMIRRPSYGQGKTVVEFVANGNAMAVEIGEREYSLEEVERNFTNAYEYLLEAMKLENESLSQVYGNLNLITYIEQYAMNVSWMSSAPELVDVYGTVNNYEFTENMSQEVVLTAVLSYLEYECQYEIDICVVEPKLTEAEQFVRNLTLEIKKRDEEKRTLETVELPQVMDGQEILYEEEKEDYTLVLVLLGVVAAIAIFPGMDKDLDGKIKERNKQMMLDYSEIVSKLNILSGAGMSIFRAWEKIVKDYEKKMGKNGEVRRFAYEEMKITYYEIQSGVSESNAYSDFGRRCNIHEYLKLGALLEQNVRKGAKGLARMLEEESIQAFEQRKNLARKLGEEAGTKMLIPMIMMLAIVMVIVLIPAFTSFGV